MYSFAVVSDAQVQFVEDMYVGNEEAGNIEVCIDSGVSGNFEIDLTVSLVTMDGTAGEFENEKYAITDSCESLSQNSCVRRH